MKIESTRPQRRRSRDQVITFYSYKGGTGRTMALANIAWILASKGHTVLAIDWDLEAPGLHRYLAPLLPDPGLAESTGLIDLLVRYMVAATKPASGTTKPDEPWFASFADLSLEAEPLDWQFPDGGRIDLLGAGRQGPSYASRVNRFDWEGFYEKFGGAAFLDLAIEQARQSYDYVLIDSRTGVSDTSGICTVHLPDSLIVFFTLNDQSIEGASGVAADVLQQRQELEARRRAKKDSESKPRRPFRIFPVATRIELAEKEKLENRRRLVRERFGRYLDHLRSESPKDYLGRMEILYDPYYAYEEILATVADQPGTQNSVLAAMELLTGYITDGAVTKLERVAESRREEALGRFESAAELRREKARGEAPAAESARGRADVYLAMPGTEVAVGHADALSRRLAPYCRVFAPWDLPAGADWRAETERAATEARVAVVFLDGSEPSEEMATLEERLVKGSLAAVIPVLVTREAFEGAPAFLQRINAVDLGKDPERGMRELEAAILHHLGISQEERRPTAEMPVPTELLPPPEPTGVEKAKGWAMRNRVLLTLAVIILGGWLFQTLRPEPAGEKAVRLTAASYQVADSDPNLSLLLAREAVRAEATVESTKALRDALRRSRLVRILSAHEGRVLEAHWSPDGAHVLSLGEDGRAVVWNLATREHQTTSGADGERVLTGAWTERGEALVVFGPSPKLSPEDLYVGLTRWRRSSGTADFVFDISLRPLPEAPASASLSPDQRKISLLTEGGYLSLWDLSSRALLAELDAGGFLGPEAWSPDGRYYALGKGKLLVSDTSQSVASQVASLQERRQQVALLVKRGLRTSRDLDRIDEEIAALQVRSRQPDASIAVDSPMRALAWHPGGEVIALGLENGECLIWSPESGPDRIWTAGGPVNWLGWTPDGTSVAVATSRESYLLYRLREGQANPSQPSRELQTAWLGDRFALGFSQGDWSPDGSALLAVTASGQIFWWQHRLVDGSPADASVSEAPPRGRQPIELQAAGKGDALFGAWSPDGTRALTAHRDGTIRIWAPYTDRLDVDVDPKALLELAEARSPRDLTDDERAEYLDR